MALYDTELKLMKLHVYVNNDRDDEVIVVAVVWPNYWSSHANTLMVSSTTVPVAALSAYL